MSNQLKTMEIIKTLKKSGKQSLELREISIPGSILNRLILTDGDYSTTIKIFDSDNWQRGYGMTPNKSIKNFLNDNCKILFLKYFTK